MKKNLLKEIYTVIVVEDNSLVYCKPWASKSSASLDAFGQAVKRNLITDKDGNPLTLETLSQKYNPWSGEDFANYEVTNCDQEDMANHTTQRIASGKEQICLVIIHVDTIEI